MSAQPAQENEATGAIVSPAVDAKTDAPKATKSSPGFFTGFFNYFRLLFYAEPKIVDVLLLFVGIFSAIAAGVPFPLIGIVFGQLLDNLNSATCAAGSVSDPEEYQSSVNSKVLLVVYLAIAQFGCIYLYILSWNLFGNRLAHRLRAKYFRSLLRQEVSYFDKLPAGDVSSRLTSDINTIQQGTSEKVGVVLGVLSMFVTAYIVAFIKYAKLAGILVSLLPAFMVMGVMGGHFIGKYSALVSKHMAAAASVAQESLANIMVVQAFRANTRLEERFTNKLALARSAGIKKAIAVSLQSGMLYFLGYSANGLAYWQGSRAIADVVSGQLQGMSVGTTYTIIFVIVDGTLVLSQMAPFIQIFASATASFEKLKEDIDRQSQIDGTIEAGPTAAPECEGDFTLENVAFSYPSRPDVPVIQDVSLRFPAGKRTAVVGLSGSGKSTIAGLLTRLYDPDRGSIYLDGTNLRDINVRELRSHVGLVQQDPLLLDRSILENIALGLVNSSRPEHDEYQPILLSNTFARIAEDARHGQDLTTAASAHGSLATKILELVQHAASLADAGAFLGNLEYGLATNVGANGDLLSGGQKQRVALARALVKDPRILVLDEATSSLDSASEQRIQKAIEQATAGRTVVSIAHRLATVKTADNIVVMRNGRIIEQGTHAELLAKDADYAALVRLQNMGSDTSSTKTATSSKDIDEGVHEIAQVPSKEVEISSDTTANDTPEGASKANPDKPTESNMTTFKTVSRYTRPYSIWLLFAFAGSTVVGGAFSGSATIFGHTVGALSPCNEPSYIRSAGSFFGLLFFILGIIELFANCISWTSFGYVAENILYVVRTLSLRSLMEQDVQWHQSEGRTPSTLLSYITADSSALGALTGSIIGTLFSIAVNFLAAVILSHVLAWRIALVCLAVVPLMLGAGVMQMRLLAKFAAKHEKAFSKSVGITVEAVNSIKTVAALSLEQEVLGTYWRSLKFPRKDHLRTSIWANLFLALTYSVANLIYALAYWWGARQIIEGHYTQTQFFIVLIALLVSAQQWGELFTLAPEVGNAGRAAARIFGLIDLGSSKTIADKPSAEKDPEAALEMKNVGSQIEGGMRVKFKQLVFSYPARPNRQVLKGLDLEVKPGQFCALVGPSGAGKSTIISLMERMYRPDSGVIEVDGTDIAARKEPTFRDDIGLVPQDNILFDGSLRFNVALGARPAHEPSDAEIEQASRLANIHDTIASLPNGYETQCGPSGGQLSGGQKQRLAIARALVRKPRLLLLDESTSALDAESERLLQDGLERATKGITVIAIAHRLHTIRRADVIFMIEDDNRTMFPVDDFLVSGARVALSNGSFRICGKELPSAVAIGRHSVCGPKLLAWLSP
ncbi:putative ABC multidrug transporter [Seiridium unicorne]|uniref:ABC multidrug transporter n=1 Tax=Seiridium unicorne TaxID=138068 RepID=A0ABR2UGF0_9PEZI